MDYLNDLRLHFWNNDFMALMSERLRLQEAKTMLDVGCGWGHFTMSMLPHLAAAIQLYGVDREMPDVDYAPTYILEKFPSLRREQLRFQQADGNSLPFCDGHLDIVGCQTYLMHQRDPQAAVTEMARVAGTGGIVICAEPDNLLHYIAGECKGYRQSVEARTAEFEFWLRHQRGKECVGEGYNAVGQDLVNLLRAAGLVDVQVYVSDKVPLSNASPNEESLSALEDMKQLLVQREGIFNPNKYRPYVEAGDGSSDVFDRGFHAFLERYEKLLDANDLESIFTPGAMYLASGRKPVASA